MTHSFSTAFPFIVFLAFFRNTLAIFLCHGVPERLKDSFAEVPIPYCPKTVLAQGRHAPLAQESLQLRRPV